MISTMWTTAPTGISGPVGLAVRTAACAAERPVASRLRELPLTAATFGTPAVGTGVAASLVAGAPLSGTGVFGTPAFALVPTARGNAPAIERIGTTDHPQQDSKHDDTTLGIHSSRRPLS